MNGVLRFIGGNSKCAFVDMNNGESYFIHKKNTGNAFSEDFVEIVETKPKTETKNAEAKVVSIISRSTEEVVGTLEYKEGKPFGFVIPNKPYGSDIFVSKSKFKGAKDGDLVSVKIDKFPRKERDKPEAMITKILGKIEDTETAIEIATSDIKSVFSKEIMKEVEEIVKLAEIELRE